VTVDPATFIGIGLAFASLTTMIVLEGANPASLLLIPPMVLVFGGSIGVAMAGGHMRDAIRAGHWLKIAFLSKKSDGSSLIEMLVKLADRARREGLLALEDVTQEVDDPFMRNSLQLAIDGTDPEELREILESEVAAKRTEFKTGAKFFTDMGGYAPTLGIIGTVIGLVNVLSNLSTPEELGHMIATAFVATLWGVLSANLMWLPIGHKIRRVGEAEVQQMEIIVEGIASIQAGVNPRLIKQKLNSLLPSEPVKKSEQAEAA
jgi:chemotaxis protein MotA